MKRLLIALVVLGVAVLVPLVVWFEGIRAHPESQPSAAPTTTPEEPDPPVSVEPVAGNMDVPATFTFAPDGRIFYGERFSGEIRIRDLATDADSLFFTLPGTVSEGEQGLLGLAVHPRFPSAPYVYAYYTTSVNGRAQNRIVRLTSLNGVGSDLRVLVSLPASLTHNGGTLLFGPGESLFAVVGENGDATGAQDTSRLTGKVLRMNARGEAMPGNPFGTRVYSLGHRNMFGIAIDPRSDNVWVTENGPECNDELNRIVPGGNYGWGPTGACRTPPHDVDTNRDGPPPRLLPEITFSPSIAPTGAVFCDGCGLGASMEGALVFGAFKDGIIRRAMLTPDREGIASVAKVYEHVSTSGVLSMARGPDGGIYFSDDNEIYRLVI